jgi:hypothetical protein
VIQLPLEKIRARADNQLNLRLVLLSVTALGRKCSQFTQERPDRLRPPLFGPIFYGPNAILVSAAATASLSDLQAMA